MEDYFSDKYKPNPECAIKGKEIDDGLTGEDCIERYSAWPTRWCQSCAVLAISRMERSLFDAGFDAFLVASGTRTKPGQTKYAIATICDQTICYITEDGSHTTKHPEAKLWESPQEASSRASELSVEQAIFLKNGGHEAHPLNYDDERIQNISSFWIEPVIDEEEFKKREDTW